MDYESKKCFFLKQLPFYRVQEFTDTCVNISSVCFKLGSGVKPRTSWFLSGFPSAPGGVCGKNLKSF